MKAYEILMKEPLPDLHAEGILLRHIKSGARVVLIPCEDTNKVFTVGFRTPPKNSTGVAHIIEHSVLCGSRKYPLKDPFVELAKGSLNTFLNAMTYPDKTIYPVASMNDADFRNLMNVYLDAVFYPNIYREENIFRQEGWSRRLEDASSPIEYNGVVYNEMKGVFSSPDEYLERLKFDQLFPDTAYGVESGGDPAVIPTLTYEEFLDFHRKYYHPSNSYLYLYGDMDMEQTLSFIDRNYLKDFDAIEVDSEIRKQKPLKKRKSYIGEYPISDEEPTEHNTYFALSSVTADPFNMKESIAFDVLDYALFSAPGAPVKQALLDAHIGSDVYGENEDGIAQPFYSVIAKGADLKDKDRFIRIIRSVLKKQTEEGISRKALLAGINTLEFAYREGDYGVYPKGLMLGINLFDTWLYDDQRPFDTLHQLEAYRELKKEVKKKTAPGQKGYFEQLVSEKFLNNPYSAFIAITPKKGLAQEREEAVARELSEYKKSLKPEEIRTLIKETKELAAFQDRPETREDLDTLPVLKRSDIRRTERRLENHPGKVSDIRTVTRTAETNGVAYVTLLFDAGGIGEEDLPYLSFLKTVIGFVDTKHYAYQELFNEIGISTGGINSGLTLYDDPKDPEGYRAYYGVKMKSLYGDMNKGFQLIHEMLQTSDFGDQKRLREILLETKSELSVTLQQMGHYAAAMRSSAYFSSAHAFNDAISGIGYYQSLKKIEQKIDQEPSAVSEKLEELCRRLFTTKNLLASCTAEESGMEAFEKNLISFKEKLPEGKALRKRMIKAPLGNLKEGFRTAGQVQFVSESGDFRKAGFAYTGALNVLRQMLNYGYLWVNIRVKGGAYGCGAMFRKEGNAAFHSFRDPNLKNTVAVFEGLPEYLEHFQADEDEMTKYIIGTISSVDIPLTPSLYDSVAMMAYMNGVKQKDRQKTRCEILDCTEEDIRELEPLIRSVLKDRYLCVIGSEGAIGKDQDLFEHIENLL